MKQLWSPWRMTYIEERNSEPGCLFCNLQRAAPGAASLVLHQEARAFVVLNRYPYTNGHLMVVPRAHVPSLENLEADDLTDLMLLTQRGLHALRQAYGAVSFNVGANIGAAAGAGVVDHVHLHIVPRWAGDTNFMATTAETRVIPEDLERTYHRLDQAWRALGGIA
jgi:ATP adenylyltransferase